MNLDLSRLSAEERQSLMECDGWHTFAQMEQWGRLKDEMGKWVGDAVRSLSDSDSSDPQVSHTLRLTLKARTDIMALVVGMVESYTQERQRLIEAASGPQEED